MSKYYLVKELLKDASELLYKHHIPRHQREAQLLFMSCLEVDELWLITHQNSEIQDVEKFYVWIERRAKNEPYEYIVNKVSFYSEEFFIDKGALIPRPETEILIDEVLKNIEDKNSFLTIVEVGVGSGIISIMLAKHLPNAKIIAVDISNEALKIAKINIEKFDLNDRVELRVGSLLEPISEDIDYLVSNPPYIADDKILPSNLSYEPQNALFGGSVGDEIIKQLLDELLKREINFFSCEIGYDQKDKITHYLQNVKYNFLNFYKDLSDFDRGFTLRLK